MRRTNLLTAAVLAAALAVAPGLAFARAGGGASMGSRGSMTYSAPRSTTTAPGSAAPMERSLSPQSAPSTTPGFGAAQPGFAGRSPFMSGLFGGLLGAGIGGLLFGGGLFHGISGFGGFLGFLLQMFLVVLLVRFLFRMFARSRQPAFAGPGILNRSAQPGYGGGPTAGGAPATAPVAISPADYQAFEQLLQQVQAAWSAQDLRSLQAIATPEMVSYFAEQLADQTSRGVRNTVTDVRLEQGDLAEAWSEGGRDYATVAMRFSMIDVHPRRVRPGRRRRSGAAHPGHRAVDLRAFNRAAAGCCRRSSRPVRAIWL